MKIEFEVWQLVTLMVMFMGCVAGTAKLFMVQLQRHLDDRFKAQDEARKTNHTAVSDRLDSIERSSREEANQWQRVERELMSLKAEMPLNYVRREDYIRGQSVIEAKLDGLATKLENAQLRMTLNGVHHAPN